MNFRAFSLENRTRCEAGNGFAHALDSWSPSDWMTAMLGEFGEAANIVKKLNRVRDGVPGNTASPEDLRAQLADELADGYIYLDLLCQRAGVDLHEHFDFGAHFDPTLEGAPSLSRAVVGLFDPAGFLCEFVDEWEAANPAEPPRMAGLAQVFAEVCRRLDQLCVAAGVDLGAAVRAKFDKTSAKIGYAP